MYALDLQHQYYISNNPDDIKLDEVCRLLWSVHWAANRPVHIIQKSIQHANCFGIFDGHKQIGFARVITDYATYAYISDVVIDGHYRGQKLGYWLINHILNHHSFSYVSQWRLKTTYAHKFYKKFGFKPLQSPEKDLEIIIDTSK